MAHERITIDPLKMGGEPRIRGMRMPVATIVRMLGNGWSEARILEEWPDLEAGDIQVALRFAAASES